MLVSPTFSIQDHKFLFTCQEESDNEVICLRNFQKFEALYPISTKFKRGSLY